MKRTTLGLVDDHKSLRNGLAALLSSFGYEILFEYNNGDELIRLLLPPTLPDIVLMDINMPRKDGIVCTTWLREKFSKVRVLGMSMFDSEIALIRMIRQGAKGYIKKDADPSEFKTAIDAVAASQLYCPEIVTGGLFYLMNENAKSGGNLKMSFNLPDKELAFLKLVSTEMSYKEIAESMRLSPRTIDGYRESLFEKVGVNSRVGLTLFAFNQGW